jgi:hypothetical protein
MRGMMPIGTRGHSDNAAPDPTDDELDALRLEIALAVASVRATGEGGVGDSGTHPCAGAGGGSTTAPTDAAVYHSGADSGVCARTSSRMCTAPRTRRGRRQL